MPTPRLIVTVLLAGVVVSVASAVPAYALTSATVAAGSAPSGTSVAVTGTSGRVDMADRTTNASASCTSSRLTGTTKAGPNAPANVGRIDGGAGQVAFTSCSTAGLPFTIDGVGTSKWTVTATGATASGTTPGTITGINVAIASSSCSFTVTGSVAESYVNGNPSRITVPASTATTSNLTISNLTLKAGATKCLAGAVGANGDKISLSGSWNLSATTAAYNPLTLTAS